MSLLLRPSRKRFLRPAPTWRPRRQSLFPRRCPRSGRILNVDQFWIQDGKLIHDGTKFCIAEECPCDPPECPPCSEPEATINAWEWDVEMTGWADECEFSGTSGNCTDFNDIFRLTHFGGDACGIWKYEFDHGEFTNVCSQRVVLRMLEAGGGVIEVETATVDCKHFFRSAALGNPLDCDTITSEELTYHRTEDHSGLGCAGGLTCPTLDDVTVQATLVIP